MENLAVFADHGFTENPSFDPQDKYRRPRYRHGGNSSFEQLIPVCLLTVSKTVAP